MRTFSWIVLGLACVLFAVAGVCWAASVATDDIGWKKRATKIGRIGMLLLLLFINVYIYAHIFGVASGGQTPLPELVDEV